VYPNDADDATEFRGTFGWGSLLMISLTEKVWW
jgi:hypothetical protein